MKLSTIRANNIASGKFWFDVGAMRFFKTKIYSAVYHDKFFVTAETGPDQVTRFSIREAIDGGREIQTVGDFGAYKSLAEARHAAKELQERRAEHAIICPAMGDGCAHFTKTGKVK